MYTTIHSGDPQDSIIATTHVAEFDARLQFAEKYVSNLHSAAICGSVSLEGPEASFTLWESSRLPLVSKYRFLRKRPGHFGTNLQT